MESRRHLPACKTAERSHPVAGIGNARQGFVLHLLRPADHFLDVGANVGSYTVMAAGSVGAFVTCVEPIPSTFAHFERNIALNGL
jgi:cyclopropane fatty-acyl-phospholipid synthase-like methyltransferase